MLRGGIFGPGGSGKTTLAREIGIEYWCREQRRGLVLDPNGEKWGPYFWVTQNEDLYWRTIWKEKESLIIVEEAAATIRREQDLKPVFTRLRHRGHKLLVVGHSGSDLLPAMRQQLDCCWLFCQPPPAAKAWAENFPRYYDEVMACWELNRHEFLYVTQWSPPVKGKLII
ncbi:MAG: hypothetical protein KGJ13_10980 [Patescibacteria group bacterium]|nr:hypothetical protein [Patescibacteria group bacterium]